MWGSRLHNREPFFFGLTEHGKDSHSRSSRAKPRLVGLIAEAGNLH
jgi:hypothetical protein